MNNERINNAYKKFLSKEEWTLFDSLHFMPAHFTDERQKSIFGIIKLDFKKLMDYGARKTPTLTNLARDISRYALFPKTEKQYILVKLQNIL